MSIDSLRGIGVALITPFKENKSVDFDTLEVLVNRLINNGIDYIVALGTTAETPTLTAKEKDKIIAKVVKTVNERVPVVVGVGGNNTMEIAKSLRHFSHQGVEAILSVTPYYNKPTQEGLFQHYRTLSEASPLPILLYNVPSRTGVNMTAETTLRIAQACENVVGIKEASQVAQAKEIIERRRDGFLVISGDDGSALPIIAAGGDGVISVLGNAFPKMFSDKIHRALRNEVVEGEMDEFTPSIALMFKDGNPAGIKCYMHLMNLIDNELRLPLVPVSDSTRLEIMNDLKSVKF